MVFAASLLLTETRTEWPTVLLLSDRTQLVRQTSGVFTSATGRLVLLPTSCQVRRSRDFRTPDRQEIQALSS